MTLEEIQSALLREANGLPITRLNYAVLADRIIPADGLSLVAARALQFQLPEWDVYYAALQLETRDWLDLACHRVAANQVRQATARLIGYHDPTHNEMKFMTSADALTGWWECCQCGYRYGQA
jgi:hypothetical protein